MKESKCKVCGKEADTRLGVCFDCAEAESIILNGKDMYEKEYTGDIKGSESLKKLAFLIEKGWRNTNKEEFFYRCNEDGSFSRVDLVNEFYDDIEQLLDKAREEGRKEVLDIIFTETGFSRFNKDTPEEELKRIRTTLKEYLSKLKDNK